MPDAVIDLAAIEAMRERLAGRIHHTPMLSSATAARVVRASDRGRASPTAGSTSRPSTSRRPARSSRARRWRGSRRSRRTSGRAARSRSRPGTRARRTRGPGRRPACPVTVVMPVGAVASKVAACRGYGAEVVLHGTHVGESLAHLEVLRAERGLDARAPVRRPRGPDRERLVRARDPRRPARRRRRRGRDRRRRPDRRGRDRDQGAQAVGARLRRRAGRVRGDDPRPRGRASPCGSRR